MGIVRVNWNEDLQLLFMLNDSVIYHHHRYLLQPKYHNYP
jgi:hypothetical protein